MSFVERLTHPDLVSLILGILLLALSIVLLLGKGGFLIAGWNTAPQEVKDLYDEKKMCRVMGFGLLVISAATLVLAVFTDVLFYVAVYLAVVLAATGVMVWLINTKCKKDLPKPKSGFKTY